MVDLWAQKHVSGPIYTHRKLDLDENDGILVRLDLDTDVYGIQSWSR